MKQTDKYFIIMIAPSGSGKGQIIKDIMKDLKITNKNTFKAMIDNYVGSDKLYKQKVKKILENNDITSNSDIKKELEIKKNDLVVKFNKAYLDTRNVNGCNNESCATKMKNNLLDAINENKNIIFETTGRIGTRFPSKILNTSKSNKSNESMRGKKYKLIIATTGIYVNSIKNRLNNRTIEGIKTFLNKLDDNTVSAPRLLYSDDKMIRMNMNSYKGYIFNIIENCFPDKSDVCGNYNISKIYVYSSNVPRNIGVKLLFKMELNETNNEINKVIMKNGKIIKFIVPKDKAIKGIIKAIKRETISST
jgi:predicted RNA-binding protein YlqC (UPF0109 family)